MLQIDVGEQASELDIVTPPAVAVSSSMHELKGMELADSFGGRLGVSDHAPLPGPLVLDQQLSAANIMTEANAKVKGVRADIAV